jgi:hypothetical protein
MDTIQDGKPDDNVDRRAAVLARVYRFLLSIAAENDAAGGEKVGAQSPPAAQSEPSEKPGT